MLICIKCKKVIILNELPVRYACCSGCDVSTLTEEEKDLIMGTVDKITIKHKTGDSIINKKIKEISILREEYRKLEEKIDKNISEVDDIYRKMVEKENSTIPIVCPFCNQFIIISGGRTAKCEFCNFSIGLSTVSDQQDEYIFYNLYNWTNKKPMVVVKKITEKELYQGRYLRASYLIEILKDKRVVEIGKIWKNGKLLM